MAIIDEIRIRQTFDPEGKNGGYSFESGLENAPNKKPGMNIGQSKKADAAQGLMTIADASRIFAPRKLSR